LSCSPAFFKSATASASLTVSANVLTVSANDASRVYGTSNPTFTGSVAGAVNGDTFTESFTTTATLSSNAGSYAIVPSATGANLSSYSVVTNNGTLTVSRAGSTTALALSGGTNPGATVTLNATVSSATTGTPTGTVSFYDGTTLLDTATLISGTASYSTSSLSPALSHPLTAVYSGDINFLTSTSSATTVTIGGLDFTMSALPPTQSGDAGTSFAYNLAIAPTYASYPGTVNFSVTGLPQNATVSFSPASLAADAGKQTVTMAVNTAGVLAESRPTSLRRNAVAVMAFLLLPLFGAGRLRREGRRLANLICVLIALLAATALTGCGVNTKMVTQTFTLTVTATSGTVQHTSTVSLDLQIK